MVKRSIGSGNEVDDSSAIQLLYQHFGPYTRLMVELKPPLLPLDGPQLARQRGLVRRQILSCTSCGLREGCSAPVPWSGPETGRQPGFLALGEAPGKTEDRRGMPFIGKSGKYLRALMEKSGIDVDTVMFANAVSCAPLVTKGKAQEVRMPVDAEMKACRQNVMDQLIVAQTRYVLLVGGTALKLWRQDMKISDIHGGVFIWLDQWAVMPIYHPAAALRDRSLVGAIERDLEKWRYLTSDELDPLECLGTLCIKCGDFSSDMDPDGVPYCTEHYLRYGGNWKKSREKWVDKIPGGEQMSLLDDPNEENPF